MSQSLSCPKCTSAIDVAIRDEHGKVTCPGCGAKYKVKGTPASPPPPTDDWMQMPMSMPAPSLPSYPLPQHAPRQTPPPAEPEKGNRNALLIGFAAVGVGCAALLAFGIISVVVWKLMGRSGDTAQVATADGAASANGAPDTGSGATATMSGSSPRTATTVVFDKSKGGAKAATPGELKVAFTSASLFDPSKVQRRASQGITEKIDMDNRLLFEVRELVPEEFDFTPDAPRWKVAADPAPNSAPFEVAPDLKFTFPDSRFVSFVGARVLPPVFAAFDGPYYIPLPNWLEFPIYLAHKPGPGKRSISEFTEKPMAPNPVVDLRTGQPAGEFEGRVPLWLFPALNPTGQFLAGPTPLPLVARDIRDKLVREELLDVLQTTFVWERDKKTPPKKLNNEAASLWLEFVSENVVAILVETVPQTLQLWDVTKGTRQASIELPHRWPGKPLEEGASTFRVQREVTRNLVAVSPGGGYVAVGGPESVALVSTTEAKVVGTWPVSLNEKVREGYAALSFTADGSELAVAIKVKTPETKTQFIDGIRFSKHSVVDGRTVFKKEFKGSGKGTLIVDADCFALVPPISDYTTIFRHNLPRVAQVPTNVVRVWHPSLSRALVDRAPDSRTPEGTLQAMAWKDILDKFEEALPNVGPRNPETAKIKLVRTNIDAIAKVNVAPPAQAEPLGAWTHPLEARIDMVGPPPSCLAIGKLKLGVIAESKVKMPPPNSATAGAVLNGKPMQTAFVKFYSVDAESPNNKVEPRTLLQWQFPHDFSRRNHIFLWAWSMSPDGRRVAISDPMKRDQLQIRDADGAVQFAFRPDRERVPVEWTEFATDDLLLTSSGGELATWKVQADSVEPLYRTEGAGYVAPFFVLPNRKQCIASLGGAFDIVDIATGRCLQRFGVDAPGAISDVAFSPDGKHVAALYVEYVSRDMVDGQALPQKPLKVVVAWWDLVSGGEPRSLPLNLEAFVQLAWLSPEHLCVVSRNSSVIDLKLGGVSVSYRELGGKSDTQDARFPLMRSPDGQLWCEHSLLPEVAGVLPEWKMAFMGEYGNRAFKPVLPRPKDESPYYAADRKLISLYKEPLALHIDFGGKDVSNKHGARLISELEERGHKIGAGGFVLSVRHTWTDSSNRLIHNQTQIPVPLVHYEWQLTDSAGRVLWKQQLSKGSFPLEKSRYIKDIKSERVVYDFKEVAPREAMISEILDLGIGLKIPPEMPSLVLFGDGKYVPAEPNLVWNPQLTKPK